MWVLEEGAGLPQRPTLVLTGQGGGAGWQRGRHEVLIGLWLLGAWQPWRPSLRVVGHLNLQGHRRSLGLVGAARVPWLP